MPTLLGIAVPVALPLLATAERNRAPAPSVRLAAIIEQDGYPVRIVIAHANGDTRVISRGEELEGCRFTGLGPRHRSAKFRCEGASGYRLALNGVARPVQSDSQIPANRMIRISAERLEALKRNQQLLVNQLDVTPVCRNGKVEAWLVRFVAAGSLAAEAGLRAGDEIVSLNGVPVRQAEAFMRMLRLLGQRPVITLGLRRAQRPMELTYILQ
ncbi:MAG: hypothetical protein D6717_07980 [Gammaproteobacteria bacterium]|nr:MAG: hypothetical protein D6717_07980 [Gammaproteobacteria bacterium]